MKYGVEDIVAAFWEGVDAINVEATPREYVPRRTLEAYLQEFLKQRGARSDEAFASICEDAKEE